MAKMEGGSKQEESIVVPELDKMSKEAVAAELRKKDEARGREALAGVGRFFGGLWKKAKDQLVQPARDALKAVVGGTARGVGMGIRGAEATAAGAEAVADATQRAGKAAVEGMVQVGDALSGEADRVAGEVNKKIGEVRQEAQKAVNQIDAGMRALEGKAQGVMNEAQARLNGVKNVYRAVRAAVGEAHQTGKQEAYAKQRDAYNQQMDVQWDGYMNQWGAMSPEQKNIAWAGMNDEQKYRCNAAYARAMQRAAEAQRLAQERATGEALGSAFNDYEARQSGGATTQQMGGMA